MSRSQLNQSLDLTHAMVDLLRALASKVHYQTIHTHLRVFLHGVDRHRHRWCYDDLELLAPCASGFRKCCVQAREHLSGGCGITIEAIPAGAETHGATEGRVGIASNNDRHVWLLDGLGIQTAGFELHP